MFNISRFLFCLLFTVSFSTLLSAQEERVVVGPKLSPVITAATAGETVRFSSTAGSAEIRVQIISATGDALFDSAWKHGNVLDWRMEQPLASGSYRCVVMVKDLDGQITQKEAVLTAEGGHVAFETRAEGLTIVAADDHGPKMTLLAHDEKSGAIVSTSGDLSFRFGKFFEGRDSEKMRLTAEGNLELDGVIHAKEIRFADGTVLSSAGGEAADAQVGRVNIPGSAAGLQPNAAARRLTPRLNAPAYQFVVDSTGVHIGTTNAYGLDVAGNVTLASNLALPVTTATAGVITFGGTRFVHGFGAGNIFLGPNAGNLTTTGEENTATGGLALATNTDGGANTATGAQALHLNTTGDANTATGYAALAGNSSGHSNAACGTQALGLNTTGDANTAMGTIALLTNTTGIGNIGVGYGAGRNLTTGNNNIDIGNSGVAAEEGTIRIGTDPLQTRAFVAGVRGRITDLADALAVVIDSNGQLGTMSSSAKFKRDISAVGEQSSALMKLRPVSFFYRGDAVGIRQYGLIAEEVAAVMPDLVQFSPDGDAETVRYHFLAPLLLDRVQNQERQIEEQQKTIDALAQRLEVLEKEAASRR